MTEELVVEGYCRRTGGDRVARGSGASDQPGNAGFAGLTSMPALGCTATFHCAEPRSQAPFVSRSRLPSFQFAQGSRRRCPMSLAKLVATAQGCSPPSSRRVVWFGSGCYSRSGGTPKCERSECHATSAERQVTLDSGRNAAGRRQQRASDWDRGTPHGAAPPTPPGIGVPTSAVREVALTCAKQR